MYFVNGARRWKARCPKCYAAKSALAIAPREQRTFPQSLRKRHLKAACEFCGFKPAVDAQLQLDHRVPQSRGGTDHPSNLQTLCANCHALKTYIEQL